MGDINVYLNSLRQKGYLAYEYNPFHNYQTNEDLYKIDKYLVPKGKAVNKTNGEILTKSTTDNNVTTWYDKRGNIVESSNVLLANNGTLFAKAGSIIDLETDKLNFDLNHPVDIEIQPSYDGSVNLILNDDKNIPRLINSRFSVREKNTYEIVDRIGENDTNIYNSESFDKDTSLYFQYNQNPTIEYFGFIDGNLLVGQYCFYFTYCDADNNESDYIAESGLIPLFIGQDSDPYSMDGGIKNQNSNKGVRLRIKNIDKSYNYLKVYYVRYFADYQQNRVYECKKIYKKYYINSNILDLNITGNEEAEDLDPNILNLSRFNPKSVLAQAQCKNMLFFGNIVKNTDNYKELQDCALRIIPKIYNEDFYSVNNTDYTKQKNSSGYYNSYNIYSKVGYFDQEYYRFGVVFIYQNGMLSNVYNTLGLTLLKSSNLNLTYKNNTLFTQDNVILRRSYIEIDNDGWIINGGKYFDNFTTNSNINSKGVCKLDYNVENDHTILGIQFVIPDEIKKFLKEELGIRGMFFVRQKCVPNIIAQCYILPMDEVLKAPIIQYKEDNNIKCITECFLTQGQEISEDVTLPFGVTFTEKRIEGDRLLNNDYEGRLYKYNSESISKGSYAAICPDFLLNQPYYNQIFNGSKFVLNKISNNKDSLSKGTNSNRFYQMDDDITYNKSGIYREATICSVTEDVPTVAIKNKTFKLNIGEAEEAFRFECAGYDSTTYSAGGDNSDDVYEQHNFVRGKYSPYLAVQSDLELPCGLYNILKTSIQQKEDFILRMNSTEPFYAISDRYNFEQLPSTGQVCWRGDCFINTFTYRVNRNFNDPSLPNNDKIIDKETWKNNYTSDSSDWENISRSDVNAVQLGSWITFKVRSAMNYALRSVDHSYVSEEALMGSPRSFYPRSSILYLGANKMPDSYLYNDAYRATLGFKCYFTLNDVNYIKDTFSNRIQYSSIAIQDSFKNNYRESFSTYFRDYSQEYGSIQKLVEVDGNILVIFEHGIGLAAINERILAGQGDGGEVFINTKNVLPEELLIITNTYGTQWGESVVKSEAGYVYGVDTIAKKIWRVKGQQIEILSDFKVNKFLIDNISLGERELYPIIGLKNVKTHYNNNKKDIMFTFYDDIYQDEEKVWNLCYNELLGQFVTFYSWIPSYSENIDTQFFTFDRNTSKALTLLNKCNYNIEENTGILVDYPVVTISSSNISSTNLATLYYYTPEIIKVYSYSSDDSDIKYKLRYKFNNVKFKIEHDHWGDYKYFTIYNNNKLRVSSGISKTQLESLFNIRKIVLLEITPYVDRPQDFSTNGTLAVTYFKTETIALTLSTVLNSLTTDFYLHGQSGTFDISENTYPTYWYGEYHPFEFEFVVNDKIGQQKIFNDLVLISNKAEPESFHFEIEGDNYEFSEDKRTMYFRQEATKELYQNLGSNILFNRYYTDVIANKYTKEQHYRTDNTNYTNKYIKFDRVYPIYQEGLVRQVKSTIFPLYYERIDTYNDVYHKYHMMKSSDGSYDFENLSGSEIAWNRDLNQFNIVIHVKNKPIDLVGRLRGNSRYKEGKWDIQIPSIIFMQKNETSNNWTNNKPPIVINSQYVPSDITNNQVTYEILPKICKGYMNDIDKDDTTSVSNISNYIDTSEWTFRKESRIRDKWIKVRVRYSGKNLAIIHSVATLYNISYS